MMEGLKYRLAEIHKIAERQTFKYNGIKEPTTMLEFIAFDFELTWVIAEMFEKLVEAKNKTPNRDYSDSELKIRILEDYRGVILAMLEENRVLNNLVFKVTKQVHIMNQKLIDKDKRIEQLEKENAELKEQCLKHI